MDIPIVVLAIDPGIDRAGVAVLVDGVPDFVTAFGISGVDGFDRGEKIVHRIQKINARLDAILAARNKRFEHDPGFDLLAVEFTDWHQDLSRDRGNWKILYARERQAQAAMAFYETVLAVYAFERGADFASLGVTQWHKSWGAKEKSKIAERCAWTWPGKVAWEKGAAYWIADHRALTDEADAMAIGYVAFAEYRMLRKIRESEV